MTPWTKRSAGANSDIEARNRLDGIRAHMAPDRDLRPALKSRWFVRQQADQIHGWVLTYRSR